MKKTKTGKCIYCGTKGLITADHVPPRSFFPKLRPKNLITVPCCESCNKSFAKDDDYVRMVFMTTEGVTENSSRNELLATVKRFAERKESKHVLSSMYRSLESVYYPTASGVLVQRQRFVIDGARLDAFAKRIVRALFYREKEYLLPNECTINTVHHRQFAEVVHLAGPDADFFEFILGKLTGEVQRQLWGDVFAYSWTQSPDHPNATWWLLELYGKPLYLCSTVAN